MWCLKIGWYLRCRTIGEIDDVRVGVSTIMELLTLCLQRDKVRKKIDKMKTPRVYEKSFKENAVRLCEYSPIVQVARELGINESMLRRWIKECFLLSLFPSRGQSQGRVRTNVEPTGFHFLLWRSRWKWHSQKRWPYNSGFLLWFYNQQSFFARFLFSFWHNHP